MARFNVLGDRREVHPQAFTMRHRIGPWYVNLASVALIKVCLSGTIVLKIVPKSNTGGSLAALYIVYMYWAPYMVFGQLIMYANVGSTSKRVVVFTISYLGYAVGNLVGPQSFLAREAPDYPTAYTVMLAGYCVTIGLMTLYGFLCWRDNKKKEVMEREWLQSIQGQDQIVAEEWKDQTDKKVRYARTIELMEEPQVSIHLLNG